MLRLHCISLGSITLSYDTYTVPSLNVFIKILLIAQDEGFSACGKFGLKQPVSVDSASPCAAPASPELQCSSTTISSTFTHVRSRLPSKSRYYQVFVRMPSRRRTTAASVPVWCVGTWPADTTTGSPHVKLAKHFLKEPFKVLFVEFE